MDRKTLILAVIGILLIILFLLALLLFGKAPEKKSNSVLLPSDTSNREFSPYNFLPTIFEDKPTEVRPQSTPSGVNTASEVVGTTPTQPIFTIPTLEQILRPLRGLVDYSNDTPASGLSNTPGDYTPINRVRDGVTNPPQSHPRPRHPPATPTSCTRLRLRPGSPLGRKAVL